MAEMTYRDIARMDLQSIAQAFRRAAEYQQAHKAITWEHGTDLVNIVARHGEIIADALESATRIRVSMSRKRAQEAIGSTGLAKRGRPMAEIQQGPLLANLRSLERQRSSAHGRGCSPTRLPSTPSRSFTNTPTTLVAGAL